MTVTTLPIWRNDPYLLVCPVGGHPTNFNYLGPFDGLEHVRLFLQTVHKDCEWREDLPDDFHTYRGHRIRRLIFPAVPA